MSYQKLEPFDNKRTQFQGLWYNAELHRFTSSALDLSQLRQFKGKIRLMVMKNRYYNGGENGRPNYVFSFVDAKSDNPRSLEIEEIEASESSYAVFTEEQLQEFINYVACDVGGDRAYGEYLVMDYERWLRERKILKDGEA